MSRRRGDGVAFGSEPPLASLSVGLRSGHSSAPQRLLHEIGTALRDTWCDAPEGSQIAHMPEGGADDLAAMRLAFIRRRGSALWSKASLQICPDPCTSPMHMRVQRLAAADMLALRGAVKAHVAACFDHATALVTDPTAVVQAGWA